MIPIFIIKRKPPPWTGTRLHVAPWHLIPRLKHVNAFPSKAGGFTFDDKYWDHARGYRHRKLSREVEILLPHPGFYTAGYFISSNGSGHGRSKKIFFGPPG